MTIAREKLPVIVVGAGCAGLSATYTLQQRGVDVLCLEAQDVAGGRCRTVVEDGYQFTIGAGVTEPQWDTTFKYFAELGLLDRVYPMKKLRFSFKRKGKIHTVNLGGSWREMLAAVPGNLRFLASAMPAGTLWQTLKVLRAMRRHMRGVDPHHHDFSSLAEISNTSTADFARTHGGDKAHDWVFHPFTATMILARPEDVSVAHPITLLSLMKGMCSVDGGLGTLTAHLYEAVRDKVRLATPVQRIVIEAGEVRGVQTAEGFIPAAHVICAVDAVQARQLIPELPDTMRRALETCHYSSTYYYQFGLDQHFLPDDVEFHVHVTPACEDTILSWTAKGSRPGEKAVMIVATRGWRDAELDAMSEEARRRLVIDEMQKIYPAFPSEPPKTKLFRWKRAVNLESPGQFTAIQDLLANHYGDVPGLYLAGEYLFLIACTEGALRTGKEAAERVLAARAADL